MNFREALEAEHSKAQTLRLTTYIGSSCHRFGKLLKIVAGDDRMLSQRGAWVISHCAEAHPEVVQPFVGELLKNLQRSNLHDAVKRNTMKAIAELEVPDELAGLAADLAFRYLNSPDEAVAVKVYSMAVIENLCRREPVLAGEFRMVIEQQWPHEKRKAFRSRARHVLAALDKMEAVGGEIGTVGA